MRLGHVEEVARVLAPLLWFQISLSLSLIARSFQLEGDGHAQIPSSLSLYRLRIHSSEYAVFSPVYR